MLVFSVCFFGFLTTSYAAGPLNPSCLEKETVASLETAKNLLTKAGVTFPSSGEEVYPTYPTEYCRKNPLACIEISKKLVSDVTKNFPTCSKDKDVTIVRYDKPKDCTEIGQNGSGVYTIWPGERNATRNPVEAYCDMETDGGGWTMLQRRGKFPVQQNFYLDWNSYKVGFGNITQEFWLGNENLRLLCQSGCQIRFDLESEIGEKRYAVYKKFIVISDYYRIHIGGYEGNAGDCMNNLTEFSTYHQGPATNIAKGRKGGWWYDQIPMANLNGIYKPGESCMECVYWYKFQNWVNLASVEIKVRPN